MARRRRQSIICRDPLHNHTQAIGDAKFKGSGGIVTHAPIRDSAVIRKDGFAVFAAGVTHRGPCKDGPGEIDVPIAIEGMVIEPATGSWATATDCCACPASRWSSCWRRPPQTKDRSRDGGRDPRRHAGQRVDRRGAEARELRLRRVGASHR